MIKLTIKSRSGKTIRVVECDPNASVLTLKQQFAKDTRIEVNRQRFTIGTRTGPALKDQHNISKYGLKDGDVLVFKNLGRQIGYSTVFFIEYAGPLFLYPIFFLRPQLIYGAGADEKPYSTAQLIALVCFAAHFIKRELETAFVHRFSNGTMPFFNLIKNSFIYYWPMSAFVSYFINHPLYTPPPMDRVYMGLSMFIVAELCNLICHIQLRNLRPPGSTKRSIPRGFLFEYVTCPNYFCEVMAWLGFTIMVQSIASLIFTIVGCLQMMQWANDKHRKYIKEFNGRDGKKMYPKNRKKLFPFLF